MVNKPKLEVIELNLGMDVSEYTKKPPIAPMTEAKAQALQENSMLEQNAINRVKDAKKTEEDKRKAAAEKIYNELVLLAERSEGLTTTDILRLAEIDDHVGLMVRLHRIVRERGDLWKIHKGKKAGQTIYRLRPGTWGDLNATDKTK